MVYLIRNTRTGAVKIGSSADPEARLRALQTATPDVLELVAVVSESDAVNEVELHRRYGDARIQGEWFDLEPGDIFEIEALAGKVDCEALKLYRQSSCIHPDLCYVVAAAVGFPVSVYWAFGEWLGRPADPKDIYQVMRWDESPGSGKQFWDWHLANRPQWFKTPEEAAAAFVASHQRWTEAMTIRRASDHVG